MLTPAGGLKTVVHCAPGSRGRGPSWSWATATPPETAVATATTANAVLRMPTLRERGVSGSVAPRERALDQEVRAHQGEHDEQEDRRQHVDLGRHSLARGAEDEQREGACL